VTPVETELAELEGSALDHLADHGGHVERELAEAGEGVLEQPIDNDDAPVRHSLAALLPAIGCGVMVGGVFTGLLEPRLYAVGAAILGGLVAVGVQRTRRVVATTLLEPPHS